MSIDYRRTLTRPEMETLSDLVEDKCANPKCGITIMVDRHDKESGRKSRCVSCVVRAKIAAGEIK